MQPSQVAELGVIRNSQAPPEVIRLRVFHVRIALIVLDRVLDRHIRGQFDLPHSNLGKRTDLPCAELLIENMAGKGGDLWFNLTNISPGT